MKNQVTKVNKHLLMVIILILIFTAGLNSWVDGGEELQHNAASSTRRLAQKGETPSSKSNNPIVDQMKPNPKVTKINAPINVACVFATGGLGDKSFNDMAYASLLKAQVDGLCTFDYSLPNDTSQFQGFLDSYAASGTYDLIVAVGLLQASAVNITAISYPTQPIVLIDSVVVQGNVRSVLFEEQEGSFLVGAMAGLMTQTGRVGFIGGMDIKLIREFWAGYTAGVLYEKNNSHIEVIEDFVGIPTDDPNEVWNNPAKGKAIAESMWAEGVDIIFTAAGFSGTGALESANEQGGGFYAIGVDADQDYLYPGRVLCSMMKRVDVAIYNAIKDVYDANWSADVKAIGLTENGVGISPLTYTKDEIGPDNIHEVNVTVRNKIISGEITIPTNSTNLAQWITDMNIVTKTFNPHGSISITSDTQLNSSFPGLGTIDDPIRIEGYNITTSGVSLIEISDTTLYFRIANNFLNGLSSSDYGVYFRNVKHGTIVENIIYHNGLDGIWLESSNYNSIINNTVYKNSWTGIKLGWSSNNNSVVSNAVFGNSEFGIWLGEGGSSNNNTITGNTIINNNWGGIELDQSMENIIAKNRIHDNPSVAITLSSSDLNTIEHNTIYGNNEGISISSSDNTIISHNTVHGNDWVGIQLSSFSKYNTIVKNIVYDTNGDGIRLYSSSNNSICHNTAYNNALNGIRLEDDITDNIIDNNTVFRNNESGIWAYNNEGMVSSYISRNIIINNRAYENTYDGIFILWSYENEISNNIAYDNNFAGIVISESDNCIISHNTINYTLGGNNDRRGISLWESRSNYISHNTVYNSEFAIQINPYHSEENNLATYNTVFNNINGFMIGGKNNEVTNNSIFNNELGIQVTNSYSNHILFNSIYNNDWLGIWIESSTYITVSSNIVHDIGGDSGINIRGSSYCIIRKNTIFKTQGAGIRIEAGEGPSNYNIITGNTVYDNNEAGIFLGGVTNNNLVENNSISNNDGYGIDILADPSQLSGNNIVRINNFQGNNPYGGSQGYDDGSNNIFILNYWSDWTSPDADGDGIVDNPYSIDEENQDPYPLVSPETHALTSPLVSNPIGGKVLSGTITIAWTASVDSLGHSVTYVVYYSSDGGNNWDPLTSYLNTTKYNWDTTTVGDGTTYRIKVVATCSEGETKEAISDRFTIQNEEPTTSTITMTTTSSSTPISDVPSISVPGLTGLIVFLSIVPLILLRKVKRKSK
ncbi:MAG: right-handed parallel beta-helix repeat-containing protein [Candidatus Hodarchaeales archaeon]